MQATLLKLLDEHQSCMDAQRKATVALNATEDSLDIANGQYRACMRSHGVKFIRWADARQTRVMWTCPMVDTKHMESIEKKRSNVMDKEMKFEAATEAHDAAKKRVIEAREAIDNYLRDHPEFYIEDARTY